MDTSVLVDFIRGRHTDEVVKLRRLVDEDRVLLGDLILCEFLRGFDTEKEAQRVHQSLAGFPVAQLCGSDIAVEAARYYRHLRALGVTVRKTVDLIVGTYCIRSGLPLLHKDRDYDAMEHHLGLKVF